MKKSFKQFKNQLAKSKKQPLNIHDNELNAVLKELEDKEVHYHDYDGSFAGNRHKVVKKSSKKKKIHEKFEFSASEIRPEPKTSDKPDELHNHPSIIPHPDHIDSEAIKDYTASYGDHCSARINQYLRDLHTGRTSRDDKLHLRAKRLMNSINKNTTNRAPVRLVSGIPAHIGQSIREAGIGSVHSNPGFHSFSSHTGVGDMYAEGHGDEEDHMIVGHFHPGTVTSVVHHSHSPEENEFIAPPGTPGIFRKHERIERPGQNPLNIYHMEYVPKRANIDDYGKPKN